MCVTQFSFYSRSVEWKIIVKFAGSASFNLEKLQIAENKEKIFLSHALFRDEKNSSFSRQKERKCDSKTTRK
jgi:hypothetical protein